MRSSRNLACLVFLLPLFGGAVLFWGGGSAQTGTASASDQSSGAEAPPAPPPGLALQWGRSGNRGLFSPDFVLSGDARRQIICTADTRGVLMFNTQGERIGSLPVPASAVAVNSKGNLIVIRTTSGDTYKDPYGTLIINPRHGTIMEEYSASGMLLGETHLDLMPGQIAIGDDDRVYALDRDRIVRLDRRSAVERTFQLPAEALHDQTVRASSFAIGRSGEVLAVLSDGRIYRWSEAGKVIGKFDRPFDTGTDKPRFVALAVDSAGNMYTSDSRCRVTRLDPAGRVVTFWGTRGTGPGQFGGTPLSLFAGSDGSVYVGDQENGRIQKFMPGAVTPVAPYSPPKILLHITSPTRKAVCEAGGLSDCREAVTAGDVSPEGRPGFVYVLVDKGALNILSVVEFGISYGNGTPSAEHDRQGIDMIDWRSCAELQKLSSDSMVPDWAPMSHDDCGRPRQPVPLVPSGWSAWPAPNSSIQLAWSAEQAPAGNLTVAGYFYVSAFSDDSLQITVAPESGVCRLGEGAYGPRYADVIPSDRGSAVFSAGAARAGRNPCGGKGRQ